MLIYSGTIRSLTGVISALLNPMWGLNISCNLDMSSVSTRKKLVWAGAQIAAAISSTPTSFALAGQSRIRASLSIIAVWLPGQLSGVCKSYMESHNINSS